MGAAKQRGTFEERRKAAEECAIKEATERWEREAEYQKQRQEEIAAGRRAGHRSMGRASPIMAAAMMASVMAH